MSFRRRIALAIVALAAAGCVMFSVVSLAALDRTLRSQTDAKLMTLARAVGQIVDSHHGRLSVDSGDIAQIAMLHQADEHLAVLDGNGRLLFGEHPPQSQRDANRFARTANIHGGGIGSILTWQRDRWITDVRRISLITFAFVAIGSIAVAALLSRVLANAILGPVERIALLAEQIEARDLSQRIGMRGNDELSRVCASFDRMLDRLEASFETERRFVADASHELRMPLAIVRAETDLALRRPREPAEYRNALESIDRELTRLEFLVDDLADSMRERAPDESEPVDVASIVERAVERIGAVTAGAHFAVAGNAQPVRGHGASIERAISAVLHNAITHGGAGEIAVRVVEESGWTRVDVKDDGPGFGSDALLHATERFWRADSTRSREGTGLGLSIARVLIEAQGGEVRLANAADRGAVVSLLLPSGVQSC